MPPPRKAELAVIMQLFSVLPTAPPPRLRAELRLNVQLFRVPPPAPPPTPAELAVSVQLETRALADSHNTPPPASPQPSSDPWVAPLVSVKPVRAAPLARKTHRTAPSSLVVPG